MVRHPAIRRLAARLGLVLGGLLAGVLVGEVLARVVRPDAAADLLFDAPGNVPDGMYVADAELGWSPNPGFRGTMRSLGYAVPIRFNALGHRGDAPTQTGGWVFLGDSFTLAAQVPEAETFVGRLAAHGPVANAGVDGYSTWHAGIRYRRAADALDPVGAVLVYFLGNDPGDDERFARGIHRMQGKQHGEPLPALTGNPVEAFLAQRSFLYGQVRVWSRRREMAAGGGSNAQKWRSELAVFTRGGQAELHALLTRGTSRALQNLRDAVWQRNDRLVVALAPPAFVVDEGRRAATFGLVGFDPATADVDAPARAMAAELQRQGVQACDLTGPLRAANTGEPLYFTYDGHWTSAGHAVVADALAACLR